MNRLARPVPPFIPALRRVVFRVAFMTAVAAWLAVAGGCEWLAKADPNALWKIVGGQCVPATRTSDRTGMCTQVDLARRYAVLKDINGHTQYLLIPTDRVSGIESAQILAPDAPEYWADAWTARRYVQAQAAMPLAASQMGLEINAAGRRSQNQLHIHIDCMRADITAALAAHRDDPPGVWRWDTLAGKRYRVMRVMGLTGRDNPFRVVGRSLDAQQDMATQTILVTGAGQDVHEDAGQGGWLIVNSSDQWPGGTSNAEGLLDHACSVGRGP